MHTVPKSAATTHEVARVYLVGNLALSPAQQQRLRAAGVGAVHTFARVEDLPEITPDDYILANNVDLNPHFARLAPARLVIVAATGYGFVDLDAVARHGVRLTNLPDYSTGAVTEYLLWAVLHAVGQRTEAVARVPSGRWTKDGLYGRELSGRTAGFIGVGQIAVSAALKFRALGMEVLGATRFPAPGHPIPAVPLEELVARCEVVCLTCREEPGTRHLLDAALIARLRDDVVLASVSANAVMDVDALAAFFAAHPDARAILDLDPLPEGHPLLERPNVIVTPHIAFASGETVAQRLEACLVRVETDLRGGEIPLLPADYLPSNRAVAAVDGVTRHATAARQAQDDLLQLAGAFRASQAVQAGLALGVFDALADGPRAVEGLADACGVPCARLTLLLRALAGMGLLRCEAGGYRNSETAARGLVSGGADDVGDLLPASFAEYAAWGRLADAVRDHRACCLGLDLQAVLQAGEAYLRGVLPRALPLLTDGEVRTVLEIGGGAATLARAVLRACPGTSAVLIDTPAALAVCARDYLAPEGLADRCTLMPAEAPADAALPDPADLVLVSAALRHLDTGAARSLLRTAAGAVRPGGALCAVGRFLDPRRTTPAATALDALGHLVHDGAGAGFSETELASWLQEDGLAEVHLHHLTQLARLVKGTRAAC